MAQDVTIRVSLVDKASAGITRLVEKLDTFEKVAKSASTAGNVYATGLNTISQRAAKTNTSLTGMAFSFNQITAVAQTAAKVIGVALDVVKELGDAGFRAFQAVVVSAGNFEEGLLRVAKVMGSTFAQQADQFRDALVTIARQSSATVADLLKVSAAAGQLGFGGAELGPFIDLVNKMAVATNDSADSVANNFAKIRNAFGLLGSDSVAELGRLGSALNELENNTPVLAKSIIDSLGRVSAARPLGLAAEDAAAFLTVIQSTGVVSSRAGTLFNRLLLDMQTNVEKIEKQFGFFGGQFKTLLETDAVGALNILIGRIRSMGSVVEQSTALNDIFGKQTIKVLQPLVSNYDQLAIQLDRVRTASAENTSLTQAFEKASEGLNAAQARLSNVFETNKALLGEELLPALTQLVNILPGLADRVLSFAQSLNLGEPVTQAATAVAAFGDIFTKTLSNLSGGGGIMDLVNNISVLAETKFPALVTILKIVGGAAGVFFDILKTGSVIVFGLTTMFGNLSTIFGAFVGNIQSGKSVFEAWDQAVLEGQADMRALNDRFKDSTSIIPDFNKAMEANAELMKAMDKNVESAAVKWDTLGENLGVSGRTLSAMREILGKNSAAFRDYLNDLNAGKDAGDAFNKATRGLVTTLNQQFIANEKAIDSLGKFQTTSGSFLDVTRQITTHMKNLEAAIKGNDLVLNKAREQFDAYKKSVAEGGDRNVQFEKTMRDTIGTLTAQGSTLKGQLNAWNARRDAIAANSAKAREFLSIENKVQDAQERLKKAIAARNTIEERAAKAGRAFTQDEKNRLRLQSMIISQTQDEINVLKLRAAALDKNTKATQLSSKARKALAEANSRQNKSYHEERTLLMKNNQTWKQINMITAQARKNRRQLTDAQKQWIARAKQGIAVNRIRAAAQLELNRLAARERTALMKAKDSQIGKIKADFAAKRAAVLLRRERTLGLKQLEFANKKELKLIDNQIAKWKAFASNTKAAFDFAGKRVQARAAQIKATFESLAKSTTSVTNLMIKGWDSYVSALTKGGRGSKEIIRTFKEQAALQRRLIQEQLGLAREQRLALERQRVRSERGEAVKFQVRIDGVDNSIKELVDAVIQQITSQFIAEGGSLCGLG